MWKGLVFSEKTRSASHTDRRVVPSPSHTERYSKTKRCRTLTNLCTSDHVGPSTVDSFGDFTLRQDTNIKGTAVDYTPKSAAIKCTWKDQGWGNQKGKLYLKLIAPDCSEKASFTVTQGVSPHDWEDIKVVLGATEAVLAEATDGCWYQVTAEPGSGGGHELFLKDLVLSLSGEYQPLSHEAIIGSSMPRPDRMEEEKTPTMARVRSMCWFLQ